MPMQPAPYTSVMSFAARARPTSRASERWTSGIFTLAPQYTATRLGLDIDLGVTRRKIQGRRSGVRAMSVSVWSRYPW